jgi:hypothetical protein
MSATETKRAIHEAIEAFATTDLSTSGLRLFSALGYRTDVRLPLQDRSYKEFAELFEQPTKRLDATKAYTDRWVSVDMLFQLSAEQLSKQDNLFKNEKVDRTIIESYLFFAIELKAKGKDQAWSRTDLSHITREVNKLFAMPVMILFKHADTLSFAVIDRRLHKREASKDVLEKVTLIKDIRISNPHRAHIEILFDLSIDELRRVHGFTTFPDLHKAWQKTLDTKELNKRFFRELANWYFHAVEVAEFPDDIEKDRDKRNATSIIRLITRLMFVWFLREKDLVPDALFDPKELKKILRADSKEKSLYYKAVLQNLFFATLNTEMGKRRFLASPDKSQSPHHFIHNVFRYEHCFFDPKRTLKELFDPIPFLNGGLFECLDKQVEVKDELKPVRIDGFSNNPKNKLLVPDKLFFDEVGEEWDFSEVYGTTRARKERVRGLIDILSSYKFTIVENTPIEEEVALDPELLGKVFENLLANYNPETKTTARKQTGSFYTPREIVNYMVDESLIAYLQNGIARNEENEKRLRHLLSYTEEPHTFNKKESEHLITAIDTCKILDPACGSGAFPMGVLHKLVHVLHKLDPQNKQWKERQIEKAAQLDDTDIRNRTVADIEDAFANNALDYGRKLYLIENSIYGVDIQPIAMQIAKLRFFISLIVDQKARPYDAAKSKDDNRGVRALPNLETKFVAANTLMRLHAEKRDLFTNPAIDDKKARLKRVRHDYFEARTPQRKEKCRQQDKKLREELAELLMLNHEFQPKEAKMLAAWDPYDQNASAPFFDTEWMFGLSSGFSVTIGNPPYVRADEQSEENQLIRKLLTENKHFETLHEKWDLFVPFMELSYKVLAPNGVTCMIVSDAFCHSKYALKPQEWFLRNSRVLRLDFCSNVKIFDAAVHNLIYFFQRADGAESVPARRVHQGEFGAVRILPAKQQSESTTRVFFPEDSESIDLSRSARPLDDIFYISVGMVVHADEKVAKGAFELADLVVAKQDKRHPKPFIEGKHLGKWTTSETMWLEWGTSRAPDLFRRPTFPQLYEVDEKILIHRTAGDQMRCCYDADKLLCNHTVMVCVPWYALKGVRNRSIKKSARYRSEKPAIKDRMLREELERTSALYEVKFVLGVMNSSAARHFLLFNRRSNTDLFPDDWKQLPIPIADRKEQRPLIKLVEKRLGLEAGAKASSVEREIDQVVYGLYGLTEEEVAIVEGSGRLKGGPGAEEAAAHKREEPTEESIPRKRGRPRKG